MGRSFAAIAHEGSPDLEAERPVREREDTVSSTSLGWCGSRYSDLGHLAQGRCQAVPAKLFLLEVGRLPVAMGLGLELQDEKPNRIESQFLCKVGQLPRTRASSSFQRV